jgi:hypothetical protein
MLATACASAAAAVAALAVPAPVAGHPMMWVLGVWALFFVAWKLLGRGVSAYGLAYGAAALAIFAGLIFLR